MLNIGERIDMKSTALNMSQFLAYAIRMRTLDLSIYIYIERESERERGSKKSFEIYPYIQ